MNTTNTLANLFLRFFAFNFNHRPALNRYLESDFGPINFTFGIRTENNSVRQALGFENGRVRVMKTWPENPDAQLIFMDESVLKEAATRPPNELMLTLMENRMVTRGNLGSPCC
jgi:formate C-acetyltransferase